MVTGNPTERAEGNKTMPDRLGVIAGYRVWHLDVSPDTIPEESLRSQDASDRSGRSRFCWSTNAPTRAECRKCERPPSFKNNCNCGLYVFHRPEWANPVYNEWACHVLGGVLAWGQTVHHKHFFRVENGLPAAFLQIPSFSPFTPRNELLTQRARTKLTEIAQLLHAPIFGDTEELEAYVREEAEKW